MIRIACIVLLYSIGFGIDKLPDFNSFNWKELQENAITIEYFEKDGIQWCRAYMEFDYSMEDISIVHFSSILPVKLFLSTEGLIQLKQPLHMIFWINT